MARQIEQATLPRVKRAKGQLQGPLGRQRTNRFYYLPSTRQHRQSAVRQAQIALAAFRAGLLTPTSTSGASIPTATMTTSTPRIQQILEGVTFIMDQAEALGIRDKVIVLVGSDFARTLGTTRTTAKTTGRSPA